jgi:hypothetical protein
MLLELSHADLRRPALCLDEVLRIMSEEFDAIKLIGAREKALKYMSKCALTFKRLRSISAEEWEHMRETERKRKQASLLEFEMSTKEWRLGPYGFIWEGGKLRRKPIGKELADFKQRQSDKENKPIEQKQ